MATFTYALFQRDGLNMSGSPCDVPSVEDTNSNVGDSGGSNVHNQVPSSSNSSISEQLKVSMFNWPITENIFHLLIGRI